LQALIHERDETGRTRDALAAQLNELRNVHVREKEDLARQVEGAAIERDRISSRLAEATALADALRQERERAAQSGTPLEEMRSLVARLEKDREHLGKHAEALALEARELALEVDTIAAERDESLAAAQRAIDEKRGQMEIFASQFRKAVQERQEALEKLANVTSAYKEEIESLRIELKQHIVEKDKTATALAETGESLSKQIEALTKERDSILGERENLLTLPRIQPISVPPPPLQLG